MPKIQRGFLSYVTALLLVFIQHILFGYQKTARYNFLHGVGTHEVGYIFLYTGLKIILLIFKLFILFISTNRHSNQLQTFTISPHIFLSTKYFNSTKHSICPSDQFVVANIATYVPIYILALFSIHSFVGEWRGCWGIRAFG